MADAEASRQAERLSLTADRIRIDAATAEVLRAFDAAGVGSLLLKGPALSGWLYAADEPRSYLDSDLWIRPVDASQAERVLGLWGSGSMSTSEACRTGGWSTAATGRAMRTASSLTSIER